MALCREPGCIFPAGPPDLVAGDGFGNAISPKLSNERCMYCRCEPKCDRACSNVAQLGPLCRPCAAREHPGCVFYGGEWRTPEEAALAVVQSPELTGVEWSAREGQLIGRAGSYLIALHCDGAAVLERMKR